MTLWVVKLGTSLLRGDTAATIEGYAARFANAFARGDQIVLVTSGAVGLGCQRLGLSQRPEAVLDLQAAAAVVRHLGRRAALGPRPRGTRASANGATAAKIRPRGFLVSDFPKRA